MLTLPMDNGLLKRMEFIDHGTSIEIVRKWFDLRIVILTAIAIFWDGFLYNWYADLPNNASALFVLFPLIQVGVGIGITYYAVAGWFNRTHIVVRRDLVSVRHRPFPWFGNKELKAFDLKQLYTKEKLTRTDEGGPCVSYEVRAVTKSGRNIKLVSDLVTQEQAIFIEQKIEQYLKIKDQAVPGEVWKRQS